MDRHLKTVLSLSNKVQELKDKNADLSDTNRRLSKELYNQALEVDRLKKDLKELSKHYYKLLENGKTKK